MAKKILIVEDDAALAQTISLALKLAGYETITAENGAKGLTAALDQSPDLIITDLDMPKMGGLAMIKFIRDSHLTIPILVHAATNGNMRPTVLVAGAQELIEKGTSVSVILDAVAKFLTSPPDPAVSSM